MNGKTSLLLGLFLICFSHISVDAQIIKLKSTEGYVQTDDYAKLHYQFLGEGKDTILVVHGGTTFGSAYLVADLTMRNKENETLDIGKFMAIYRKEKGQWRLQTDIFNSSLETRSPLEIPDYLTV